MKNTLLLTIIIAVILFSCQSKPAESEATVPEPVSETLFQNDYAEVLKVSLEPGAQQPEHDGEMRLIYSLNDYTIQWSEGEEDQGIKEWKAGDIHFHTAGKHAAKNTGTDKAEWLLFTKKTTELPPCDLDTTLASLDAVAGEMTETLFENNHFKVNKVSLKPGAAIQKHAGINRLIYALTDYEIIYQAGEAEPTTKSFQAGKVHWHEGCVHAVENAGGSTAEYLVVAYK